MTGDAKDDRKRQQDEADTAARRAPGVAVAVVIALLLIGGIITTSLLANIANTQRKAADAERLRAEGEAKRTESEAAIAKAAQQEAERASAQFRDLASQMLIKFPVEIATLPGYLQTRERLIPLAQAYLRDLAARAVNNADLTLELVNGYIALGDIQGGIHGSNLGRSAEALESYQTALAACEELVRLTASDPKANREAQQKIATVHIKIGDVVKKQSGAKEAIAHYRAAQRVIAPIAESNESDFEAQSLLATTLLVIGDCLLELGLRDDGLRSYQQSIAMREKLFALRPTDPKVQRDLTMGLGRVAEAFVESQDYAAAQPHYLRMVEVRAQLLADDPQNITCRRDLASARKYLGENYVNMQQWDKARESYEMARSGYEDLLRNDSLNVRTRTDMGYLLLALADAVKMESAVGPQHDDPTAVKSQGEMAARYYAEAAAQLEPLVANDVAILEYVARLYTNWGTLEMGMNQIAGARTRLTRARELFLDLAQRNPSSPAAARAQDLESILQGLGGP